MNNHRVPSTAAFWSGKLSIDEARERVGLPPWGIPETSRPLAARPREPLCPATVEHDGRGYECKYRAGHEGEHCAHRVGSGSDLFWPAAEQAEGS